MHWFLEIYQWHLLRKHKSTGTTFNCTMTLNPWTHSTILLPISQQQSGTQHLSTSKQDSLIALHIKNWNKWYKNVSCKLHKEKIRQKIMYEHMCRIQFHQFFKLCNSKVVTQWSTQQITTMCVNCITTELLWKVVSVALSDQCKNSGFRLSKVCS